MTKRWQDGPWEAQQMLGSEKWRIIYHTGNGRDDWFAILDGLSESTARLIAAAHDMLEELERIAAFAPGNGEECEIIARGARRAIAKATKRDQP